MSISGTSPGFDVDQIHVPLNFDVTTALSIALVNQAPFVNTFGTLDPVTGQGSAAFDLTGLPLPAAAIGLRLYFAYVEGEWKTLPDFNRLAPLRTGTTPIVDLSVAPNGGAFGLRFAWQ